MSKNKNIIFMVGDKAIEKSRDDIKSKKDVQDAIMLAMMRSLNQCDSVTDVLADVDQWEKVLKNKE